jgi:hypothetical protein
MDIHVTIVSNPLKSHNFTKPSLARKGWVPRDINQVHTYWIESKLTYTMHTMRPDVLHLLHANCLLASLNLFYQTLTAPAHRTDRCTLTLTNVRLVYAKIAEMMVGQLQKGIRLRVV